MSRRALITGITGMDGSHMAEMLLEKGYQVFGFVRHSSQPNLVNIESIRDKVEILVGDMTDSNSLHLALKIAQPHEVYNFAAQSFVSESWDIPEQTSDVDALGVLRLLEAVKNYHQDGKEIRLYQASSSEMFGKVRESPQTERTPFYPRSPYGVAKVYGHWITMNYRESYDVFAVGGIAFNHESWRRGLQFVTRKISRNVARIKLGMQKKFSLGDVSPKRDWGFAPDYCEAMWLMLQQDEPRDYVIATGVSHTVEEFLVAALNAADLPTAGSWREYVDIDESLFRPAEVVELRGDSSKLRTVTGWAPRVSFDELVCRMVKHDIEDLSK